MDPVLPEGCLSPILQPGEINQAEQDASAALAIIMCILSSLGSLLIILSYILIKSVRTKAREILVHISVMDLTYSVANLIGAAVDFDTKMREDPHNAYLRNACTTDGWFAIYGTTGSVLWTIGLAIYLYFKVITIRLHPRSRMMRALTVGLYLVGYLLPCFISMYFYALGLLGSNKFLSSGWCTVDVFDSKTQERFILPYLIGYDMWMYMAIILIPLLVIATKYQIDSEVPVCPCIGVCMSVYLKLSVYPCISNCLSVYLKLSICLSQIVCLSISNCLSVYLKLSLGLSQIVCLSISNCLSVCLKLSVCLSQIVCLSISNCLSVYVSQIVSQSQRMYLCLNFS